jgi:CPA2 family monovalent cation:H+ antiporter-2
MFLADLLVVFAVTAVVVFVFGHFRLPSVVGLLVSGVLVGPYGLSLVADVGTVQLLAEIGVIVLLFTVGLEFSLSRLVVMLPLMARIGLPQIVGTTLLVTLATSWYLGTVAQAVFAGVLVAMSSTAIVLKLLADRGETGAPHGRIAVAVLLLQDLLVVVAMLAVPLLADAAGVMPPAATALPHPAPHPPPLFANPVAAIVAGLGVVAGVIVAGRRVVPAVLHEVVRQRNRELFLITIVLVCLGTAAITAQVGLSLALGAFLAGLSLAESEYGHQAFTEVLPFRDTLASLFFVSVGMLLDIRFLVANAPLVAATVVAIMVAKMVVTAVPAWLAGFPVRTSILAGAGIAQVGEFSFVLGSRGAEAGLLDSGDYQTFLAAAVITMAATPLVTATLPALLERLARTTGWGRRLLEIPIEQGGPSLADHVVIAGFGLNGRNLAAALGEFGVPHVILEINPGTVRRERLAGHDIRYGDCTRAAVLEHAGLARARAYVVAISDPASTRRSVRIARELAPAVRIFVRTEHLAEVDELEALGADQVIPAEFETALALFDRVLGIYDVPEQTIDKLLVNMRLENYGVLREGRPHRPEAGPVSPPDAPSA